MAYAGTFTDAIRTLEYLGITDVVLPFLLIFTLVFAVLQKTKILGNEDGKPHKNFNVIIALVMALAVIIPHVTGTYPPNSDVVNIINRALPNVSVVMVAILMLLLMVGVFGKNINIAGSNIGGWVVILSIVAVVAIFGAAAEWYQMPYWLSFLNNYDTQALIVVALVFGVVIWFITKDDSKKSEGGFAENFKKLLTDDKNK